MWLKVPVGLMSTPYVSPWPVATEVMPFPWRFTAVREACSGLLCKWCSLIFHWPKQIRPKTRGEEVPSVHHEATAIAGTFNSITGREWRIESNNPTHRTILMFRITSHQPLNHTCSFGLFWTPLSAWLGLSTEISSHCHGVSYRENVCSRLFWCPPCNHSPAAVSVGC